MPRRKQEAPYFQAEWRASWRRVLRACPWEAWTRLVDTGRGAEPSRALLQWARPHVQPAAEERTHPRAGTRLQCGVLSPLSRAAPPAVGTTLHSAQGRQHPRSSLWPPGPRPHLAAPTPAWHRGRCPALLEPPHPPAGSPLRPRCGWSHPVFFYDVCEGSVSGRADWGGTGEPRFRARVCSWEVPGYPGPAGRFC